MYVCVCACVHVCICMCMYSVAKVVYDSVTHGLGPSRLLCPWDFPGKNTGMGCHFFPQGIFPTQELNQGLSALQADYLPTELYKEEL